MIRSREWDIEPTRAAAEAMRGNHKAMRDFSAARVQAMLEVRAIILSAGDGAAGLAAIRAVVRAMNGRLTLGPGPIKGAKVAA